MKKYLLIVLSILLLLCMLVSCGDNSTTPDNTDDLPEHVHNVVVDAAKEATCIEKGLTEGKHCSECGEILVKREEVPLKLHTYDDDNDAICNVCDFERYCVHRNTQKLDAIEATCTSTGLTEGEQCLDCEEIITEQTIVGMFEHDYSIVAVTAPTCEQDGFTTYECACGASYTDNEVSALGHSYGSWYMYRDDTTPIEGEGRRNCTRKLCAKYDSHVASSGFNYTKSSTECSIKNEGTCTDTVLFIPFNIDGYEVTSIYSKAFLSKATLIEVIIPSSVVSIGSQAFAYCKSLENIVLPDSVTNIGKNAFRDCSSLNNVILGELTTLEYGLFHGCSSLTEITIPNSVTKVGGSVFSGCEALASITIGSSVTAFLGFDFSNCTSLTDIYYNGDITGWLGIEFSDDKSTPMCYGKNLYISGKILTEVDIPDSITNIKPYAFYRCKTLESITIPNSVTDIGNYAFYSCESLKNITIPKSVMSIGENSFYNCKSMASVTFESNSVLSTIGQYAFYECSMLVEMHLPDSLTTIGDYIFFGCASLTNATVPNSVLSNIEKGMFRDCASLKSIIIGDSVPSISERAFETCASLESVVIGSSVTNIGNRAFANCSKLKNIVFSENSELTTIGEFAFSDCASIEYITIPSNVINIERGAFFSCVALKKAIIPQSVTNIGEWAFGGTPSIVFYCEAESQPSGWNSSWNLNNRPVVWGYTGEEV